MRNPNRGTADAHLIAPNISVDKNWSGAKRQPGTAEPCAHDPGCETRRRAAPTQRFWRVFIEDGSCTAEGIDTMAFSRLCANMSGIEMSLAGPGSKPGCECGDDPEPPLTPIPGKSRYLIAITLAIFCLTALGSRARASCNDDCRSEYVSALNDCRSQYEHGDQDLQDLEDCIGDTKDEYDDCVDECTSLGAGGVVACSSRSTPMTLAVAAAPACRASAGGRGGQRPCNYDKRANDGKHRRRAIGRARHLAAKPIGIS
jgi:hypothetical protein